MAIALIVCLVGSIGGAEPRYPVLSGRVVDEVGLLTVAARDRISAQLEAHERATTNQIILAVIASLQGYDIAEYGVGLGRAWKIGTKESNGVLLIVAPNERRLRIEVGYGLEGKLTDARAAAIIRDEMTPAFRQGHLKEGIDRGVLAILRTLEDANPPGHDASLEDVAVKEPLISVFTIFLFFLLVFLLLVRFGGAVTFNISSGSGDRSTWSGGSRSFSGRGGSFGGGGASGRW